MKTSLRICYYTDNLGQQYFSSSLHLPGNRASPSLHCSWVSWSSRTGHRRTWIACFSQLAILPRPLANPSALVAMVLQNHGALDLTASQEGTFYYKRVPEEMKGLLEQAANKRVRNLAGDDPMPALALAFSWPHCDYPFSPTFWTMLT